MEETIVAETKRSGRDEGETSCRDSSRDLWVSLQTHAKRRDEARKSGRKETGAERDQGWAGPRGYIESRTCTRGPRALRPPVKGSKTRARGRRRQKSSSVTRRCTAARDLLFLETSAVSRRRSQTPVNPPGTPASARRMGGGGTPEQCPIGPLGAGLFASCSLATHEASYPTARIEANECPPAPLPGSEAFVPARECRVRRCAAAPFQDASRSGMISGNGQNKLHDAPGGEGAEPSRPVPRLVFGWGPLGTARQGGETKHAASPGQLGIRGGVIGWRGRVLRARKGGHY